MCVLLGKVAENASDCARKKCDVYSVQTTLNTQLNEHGAINTIKLTSFKMQVAAEAAPHLSLFPPLCTENSINETQFSFNSICTFHMSTAQKRRDFTAKRSFAKCTCTVTEFQPHPSETLCLIVYHTSSTYLFSAYFHFKLLSIYSIQKKKITFTTCMHNTHRFM